LCRRVEKYDINEHVGMILKCLGMYRYRETESFTFVRSGSNVVISLLLQAVCYKVYLQVLQYKFDNTLTEKSMFSVK